MALDEKEVERLASKARDIATLASVICNCTSPEESARALEILRTVDDALEQAHTLAQEMIAGAEE